VGPHGDVWLEGSINSGVFWQFIASVPTSPVAYPLPEDWFDLDPSLQVNNVLLRAVTVDGDDTSTLTHGTLWVDMVSSDTPPDTETPTPPDVPDGAPWGTLILDLNANSL
jgi:hypothetical protein